MQLTKQNLFYYMCDITNILLTVIFNQIVILSKYTKGVTY